MAIETATPFPFTGDRRFREPEHVGRGGMGRVWRVHHRDSDVWVAVKVPRFREGVDRSLITSLFRDEVRAYARFDHPNIVKIVDHGCDEPLPWCATRWIEGEPLADWLERAISSRGDRSGLMKSERRRLIGWIIDAADAMTYAHAREVSHRDLTPWNLLLEHHPEDSLLEPGQQRIERLVIIDFGLTRLGSGSDPLENGYGAGTPGYAAPEVVFGENADPFADVFGLGAILFAGAVGDPPPPPPSNAEIETECKRLAQTGVIVAPRGAAEIRFDNQIALALENAKTDRNLAAIIRRALAYDPANRYSMKLFGDDLKLHQRGLLPQTRLRGPRDGERDPAGRREIFGSFCREHSRMIIAAALLTIVALSALIVGWNTLDYYRKRIELERRDAYAQRRDAHNARAQAGRTLAREGRYPNALEQLDAAISDGFEANNDDLERLRLRVLQSLSLRPRFDHELRRLTQPTADGAELHPDIQLIQADFLLSDSERFPEGQRILETIGDRVTNPADQDYIRGLLEPNLIEARHRFQETLATDYFHHYGRRSLVVNLVICGEFAEAKAQLAIGRALFPWDSVWDLVQCLIDLAERDRSALERHAAALIASAEPRGLSDAAQAYREALLAISDALEAIDKIQPETPNGFSDWMAFLNSFAKVMKSSVAFDRVNRDKISELGFRVATIAPMFESAEHVQKAVKHMFWLRYDLMAEEFEASLAARPDAAIAYMAGAARVTQAAFAELRKNHDDVLKYGRLARDHFLRSIDMPTLLPKWEFRYSARWSATLLEAALISEEKAEDPERRARWEKLFQSLVPEGRAFKTERERLLPMICNTFAHTDPAASLWLAQTWLRDEPESLIALACLAQQESQGGNHRAASIHAEEYLKKTESKPKLAKDRERRGRMEKVLEQSLSKIRETPVPAFAPLPEPPPTQLAR